MDSNHLLTGFEPLVLTGLEPIRDNGGNIFNKMSNIFDIFLCLCYTIYVKYN